MTAVNITEAALAEDVAEVGRLFREYEAGHADKQCFGAFEAELAALPQPYVTPDGGLMIARLDDGTAVGCAALARIDSDVGELRRLYVRPGHRRQGIGRALVETVIAAAERLGYRTLCLQTLPSMAAARQLYSELGFTPLPPIAAVRPGRIYLELPVPADGLRRMA